LQIEKIVYTHTLDANNIIHFVLLTILFMFFCFREHKTVWFKSLALLVLSVLALDSCVLLPTSKVAYEMMLYSCNVALLYFWSRLLRHFKSKGGLYFDTFIFAFLISSQYILNIHYDLPMFSYLTAGLVAGHLAWLHARFTSFYISDSHLWSIIITALIAFELCLMQKCLSIFIPIST